MKLHLGRRRSRARRAADAAETLTKLGAAKKAAGVTGRGARRGAKAGIRLKAAKGAARHPRATRRAATGAVGLKAVRGARTARATARSAQRGYRTGGRRGSAGTTSRGRKLALLAVGGALAGALAKTVKDRQGGSSAAPATDVPPAPNGAGADLQQAAPNRGATGLAPEAVHQRS